MHWFLLFLQLLLLPFLYAGVAPVQVQREEATTSQLHLTWPFATRLVT